MTHRWIKIARQCYSDTDLANADTFIRQASNNSCQIKENKNLDMEIIDPQTLNKKQIKTAEIDKSYLIKAIRYLLHQIAEVRSKLLVLVLASTDAATFNINSIMIYLILSLAINDRDNKLNINSEKLKKTTKE
ncbi:31487_t:CDS:2, partial [Racocetra persica]